MKYFYLIIEKRNKLNHIKKTLFTLNDSSSLHEMIKHTIELIILQNCGGVSFFFF